MAKSCFLGEKEIQSRRTRWLSRKNFSRRELLNKARWRRISNDLGSFSSSGKLKQQFVSGWQNVANYVKILNDLSLAQEERRLRGEERNFPQYNTAIHNTSIKEKYLLEQKIRLLEHPEGSPDLNLIENLWWLIVTKVYERGRQYLAISELKNVILFLWKKFLRFNFKN